MAGLGEADEPTAGIVPDRPALTLRRQILRSRSGTAGRGVHPLPLLYANQAGPCAWHLTVQRQDCRSHRVLPGSGCVLVSLTYMTSPKRII